MPVSILCPFDIQFCEKCPCEQVYKCSCAASAKCELLFHCFGRYEQSEWGWKEREKREEMKDERAWYLLAFDADSTPLAFSHFRFDVECGDEVLYW